MAEDPSGTPTNEPTLMSPRSPKAHVAKRYYPSDPLNLAEYEDDEDIHLSPPRPPSFPEPRATYVLTASSKA
jgi:hypothetical protein